MHKRPEAHPCIPIPDTLYLFVPAWQAGYLSYHGTAIHRRIFFRANAGGVRN